MDPKNSKPQAARSDSQKATTEILDLAAGQHGVMSRKQLMALGLSARLIDERVARKKLSVVFPGVYALDASAIGQHGRWLAATLSCCSNVALCRRSAAMLWGLDIDYEMIEVVSGSMRRSRVHAYRDRGLLVHQTRSLPESQVSMVKGVRVTTVGRMLLDLTYDLSKKRVEALFHEADRSKLLEESDLELVLADGRGRKGVKFLRQLMNRRNPENSRTRSYLESKFLDLCRERNIPLPMVNRRVMGLEVDCFWPKLKFVVELDGLAFHSLESEVERDHRRDATLQSAGFQVLRLTYRTVIENPDLCEELVRSNMLRAAQIVNALQLPAKTHLFG